MASKTTNFSIRMDVEVKKQCEEIFNQLGMNLTTAINIFLKQSIRSKGMPFEVRLDSPAPKVEEVKSASPNQNDGCLNLV